jgi:hypothetical protein
MTTAILTENVAGPFTMTWAPLGSSAATLGIVGSKGIKEIRRYEGEEISADLLGNGAVDAVHLGSQMFLEFELEEPNRYSVMLMSHPFMVPATADLAGTQLDEGEYGTPGLFYTDVYGILVATPAFTGLTSAALQSTPTRTYGLCTLAPGWEMEKLLSSRRKTVPVRLRCWPYDSGAGRYVFHTKS